MISDDTTITARPCAGQLVDEAVDFSFRADIDTARRLVENQNVCVRQHPFADHQLLLIAARIGRCRGTEVAAKLQAAGDVASRHGNARATTRPQRGYDA